MHVLSSLPGNRRYAAGNEAMEAQPQTVPWVLGPPAGEQGPGPGPGPGTGHAIGTAGQMPRGMGADGIEGPGSTVGSTRINPDPEPKTGGAGFASE